MTAPRPQDDAAIVRTHGVIRIALLMGVLLFGALTWALRRQGAAPPAPDIPEMPFNVVMYCLWAAAIGAALLLRPRVAAEPSMARRATLSLIGLAMGEAAALFGAVRYFLGGNPQPYLLSLFVMLAVYVILPLRRLA